MRYKTKETFAGEGEDAAPQRRQDGREGRRTGRRIRNGYEKGIRWFKLAT